MPKSTRIYGWFWILVSGLLGSFLFLAGLGVEPFYIKVYGVLVSLLLIGLAWLWKGKVALPKSFKFYLLFLLLFAISLIWSQDRKFSFEQLLLFLSGGLFWIAFYNLSAEFGRWLDRIVVILGVVFGGLFILNHFWGEVRIRPWGLFLPYTSYYNHNNIGDFWAVVLTIVLFHLIKNKRNVALWILVLLGTYLLFMSQSRAAHVALAVGVIYLAEVEGWIKKYKRLIMITLFLIAVLFLTISAQKTTLFSRQYFVQALVGLFHNPFGVGVGNFGLISTDPANWILGLSHPSIVVHNIVLEIIAGMGILGIVFAVWLVKVSVDLWNRQNKKTLVYQASFFALTANFLFHSTYFVPTMLWLWFAFLGISQGEERGG